MNPGFNIPLEFVLFAATLLGVAIFHHRTLTVAVTGLLVIIACKLGFSDPALHKKKERPLRAAPSIPRGRSLGGSARAHAPK